MPPTDTGEVVRMALGAGADLAGRNSWTAFAGGIPFFDTAYTGKAEPGPWYQYLRQGWLQLARGGGWLEVNADCQEYLPDAAHADYEMHPKAIAAQPGGAGYVIFDADYPTTIWETLPPPMLDDRPMTADDPEYPWFGKFSDLMPKNWLDSVQQAIDLGGIKHSPTIEGLAAELGLDPGRLAEAVNTWNAKAAAGRPDEFGRLPQNIKPIRKLPFYGIKTGPLIAGIFCGPRVNHPGPQIPERAGCTEPTVAKWRHPEGAMRRDAMLRGWASPASACTSTRTSGSSSHPGIGSPACGFPATGRRRPGTWSSRSACR